MNTISNNRLGPVQLRKMRDESNFNYKTQLVREPPSLVVSVHCHQEKPVCVVYVDNLCLFDSQHS